MEEWRIQTHPITQPMDVCTRVVFQGGVMVPAKYNQRDTGTINPIDNQTAVKPPRADVLMSRRGVPVEMIVASPVREGGPVFGMDDGKVGGWLCHDDAVYIGTAQTAAEPGEKVMVRRTRQIGAARVPEGWVIDPDTGLPRPPEAQDQEVTD